MRARLEAELADSRARHPRLRSAFGAVVGWRLWIVVAGAFLVALLDGRGAFSVQDPRLFVAAGKRLFTGNALNVFADKAVQEGPLALSFWGVVGYASELLGLGIRMVASVSIYVSFVVAGVLLVRSSLRERARPSADVELFVAMLALAGGLTWTMLSTGHVAEGFIPLLWFQAARLARHGRSERAALLVGLSAGLKLWGVLGVPLLLLDPALEWRKLGRGVVIAGGVAALLYAPFALLGTFHTFDYRWEVAPTSLIHKLFSVGTFSWQMRALQSLVVVGVGAGLAWLIRGRQRGDWAVPLGILGAKLLLDPIVFEYYPLSVAVVALLAAALIVKRWPPWMRLPGAALVYLLLYPSWLLDGNGLGAVALIVAAGACVEAYRMRRARTLVSG